MPNDDGALEVDITSQFSDNSVSLSHYKTYTGLQDGIAQAVDHFIDDELDAGRMRPKRLTIIVTPIN